jgi:hypothetical protein
MHIRQPDLDSAYIFTSESMLKPFGERRGIKTLSSLGLVQKLLKLLTFVLSVHLNPIWPPNEPHGTIFGNGNILNLVVDTFRIPKK